MRRVTRKKFGEWLNRFDDETIVGYTAMACECPIANYFGEVEGIAADVTTGSTLFTNSRNRTVKIPNPKWVRKFIVEIDNSSLQFESPITAGDAKKAFNYVIKYDREFVV